MGAVRYICRNKKIIKTMKASTFLKIAWAVIVVVVLLAGYGAWRVMADQLKAAQSVEQIGEGIYTMSFEGDYGFAEFLEQGGASTDAEMAQYITRFLTKGMVGASTPTEQRFGCSTLAVQGNYFCRNFDWTDTASILVIKTRPQKGYASVSTCNYKFLGFGDDWTPTASMMNRMMALAAIYVPLDGMNEKGLCVADLMAGDEEVTNQTTEKPDLTTVATIRMLLDYAATTDEALELLEKYDMHSSIGSAHHLAITDAKGHSVVAEWVNGKMVVTESPVVTNHYLCGKTVADSQNSYERFNRLQDIYKHHLPASINEAEGALQSVAGTQSTQWSIVFDQKKLSASYWFRADFNKIYEVNIN